MLDGFAGSGSIFIAAHKTGRRARGIEIDLLYCDTIIQRWQSYAKDDAVLVNGQQSFAEVAMVRKIEREAAVIPVLSSLAKEKQSAPSSETHSEVHTSWPWVQHHPSCGISEDLFAGTAVMARPPSLPIEPEVPRPTIQKGQGS